MKIPRTYLLVLVSMCCLIAVNIGLLSNVQGLFLSPIADELGVLRGEVSLTITISGICGGLGGMLVLRMVGAKRLRVVIALLAAVSCLSTAGLSLCHSIVAIYALYAVRGLVSGLLGLVFATTVLNNWFHASIGLFTSIAVGTSGLAGSVFSLVFSDIIESVGWRMGYVIMAVCALVLMLPALLFVPAARPEDVRRVPFGETSQRVSSSVSDHVDETKSRPVSSLVLAMLIVYSIAIIGPSSMSQHLPGLAESYGLAAGIGAAMLSAAMVANTVGKIAFGILSDRMGARRTILLYFVLVASALAGMLLLRGTGTLIGASALFGLTFSLNTVGVTLATRELCGTKNYGRVYPLVTMVGCVSYAALSSANGYVYDFTGGYTASLVLVLAMLVVATASIVVAYRHTDVAEEA